MKKTLSLFNREFKTYGMTYINLGTLKLLFIAIATISFIVSIGGSRDAVDFSYIISTVLMVGTVWLVLITPFILFIKSILSDRKRLKIIKELPISQFRYYFIKILLIILLTFIEVGIVYIIEELFAIFFGGYGIMLTLSLPLGIFLFPILTTLTVLYIFYNCKFELRWAFTVTYLIITAMPVYLIFANFFFVVAWLFESVYQISIYLCLFLSFYSFISLIMAGKIADKYSEIR